MELTELRAEVASLTEERAALQTKLAAHMDSLVSNELAAAAQNEVCLCVCLCVCASVRMF